MKPARIYPVCVSYEPAVESFFFTTYSNEVFQKEGTGGLGIQPVTMMSVNELEGDIALGVDRLIQLGGGAWFSAQ